MIDLDRKPWALEADIPDAMDQMLKLIADQNATLTD